jgi:hypothetical protein
VIKPGGELIINVPNIKNSCLRKLRLAIGQTDEMHGHVRPGYTAGGLKGLLADRFTMVGSGTYSKFFSECIDTLIRLGSSFVKKGQAGSRKGVLITDEDLRRNNKMLKVYSVIFPLVWLFCKLDGLLFWSSGYMLIAKARSNKR